MNHPQQPPPRDPRDRPPGQNATPGRPPISHYGQTQYNPTAPPAGGYGTPPPPPAPPTTPVQPPAQPQPWAAPTAQHPGGQYPGTQYPGTHYPAGQYPGPQAAGGQYPPGQQFGGPPPVAPGPTGTPPGAGGSNKIVWISVAAVLVVAAIVGGVVAYLILSGDDGGTANSSSATSSTTPVTQTVDLDRGVTVEIETPDGWTMDQTVVGGARGILFTLDGDSLNGDNFEDTLADFGTSSGPDEVHFAYIEANTCGSGNGPRPTSDSWRTYRLDGSNATGNRSGTEYGHTAGSDCLFMIVVDSTMGSTLTREAQDVFGDLDSVIVDVAY